MSVLEEVLLEEYGRSLRVSEALEAELAGLPRGSVRERVIGGRSYYYLQYREGGHVRSDYIPRDAVDGVREQLRLREEDIAALREQERSRRQIERALGRDYVRERAGA